jgi:hypothetical protein
MSPNATIINFWLGRLWDVGIMLFLVFLGGLFRWTSWLYLVALALRGYTLVVNISGYCAGRINFVMPDYTPRISCITIQLLVFNFTSIYFLFGSITIIELI